MFQPLIEIKKPCLENLDKMKPDEKGKFCNTCQMSVVDFTSKTPEEISAYFLNHKSEYICGSFERVHVKTNNKLDNFISYLHAGKLKFLAVLLVGILILTGCRTRKTTTYIVSGRALDNKPQSIENLK